MKSYSLVGLCLIVLSGVISCQSAQIREKRSRLQKSAHSLKTVKVIADDPKTVRPKPQWGPQEKILAATLKAQEPSEALQEIKAVQKENRSETQALLMNTSSVPTERIPSSVPESAKSVQPQRQFLKGFASHRLTIEDLSKRQDKVFAALDQAIQRSSGLRLQTYMVQPGQSLQIISLDLYLTTRRWPEIYLLNRTQLKSWNTVHAGQKLKVIAPNP